MSNPPTLSLVLSPAQLTTLRSIALEFGLTIGRGPMSEDGSIQKLAEALADGRLVIVKRYTFVCCKCNETKPLEVLHEASMQAGGWVCSKCEKEAGK